MNFTSKLFHTSLIWLFHCSKKSTKGYRHNENYKSRKFAITLNLKHKLPLNGRGMILSADYLMIAS